MAFGRLRSRLAKTHDAIMGGIQSVVGVGGKGDGKDSEVSMESLEEALIRADVGVNLSMEIVEELSRGSWRDTEGLRERLSEKVQGILRQVEGPLDVSVSATPYVIMVVGVNGVGKTTTVGKLATWLTDRGKTVMLGAGDTFRAAAVEQLEVWGKRVGCTVVKHHAGGDPGAVAFDTIKSARAKNIDVVILDTAGRLHTKVNLMEELKKIQRVVQREIPDAPHENLLVVDGSTGQNALDQARLFNQAVGVTGMVVTKLDGTAKGGIVIPIANELKVPIRFIGVGEGVDDMKEFYADEFTDALI
ncbi:Signal recognition particle receptor FtsY [hydrothermal vent metagenome]|uniref:Signal recognition particle receptor FtsY n=1 Tax=hydrothermal vent metagenome TaxID=652676 RepID=A0A3B0QV50_9ZZZZ